MNHKIKPYIPRKLSPNSPEQYLTFIKRRYKTLPRFIPNQPDYTNSHYDFYDSKRFPKLFFRMAKQLKYVHEFGIEIFRFLEYHSRPSKMLYFIKRMSRIKILEVNNSRIPGCLRTFSHLWPKYMKNPKTLSVNVASNTISKTAFSPIKTCHLNKLSSIRFISKYQNRLKDLQIHFTSGGAQRLYPQFSCPSLQKLAFIGGLFQLTAPSTSFDHFPNLKVLQLDFHERTSAQFINSILCLLPKVPNLESLSFMCPNEDFPGLKESFRSMKILTMLKSVKIHDCYLSYSYSKTLLKVLRKFPLTSLSLKVQVREITEVSLIQKLLDRLTQLETLSLEIVDRNHVIDPSTLKEILEKVDSLDSLKSLSFTTWLAASKRPGRIIELPFPNLFIKEIPLEVFKIKCFQFEISNEALFSLLKALRKRASHFKKINIRIGEKTLEPEEFTKLLKLLKKFSEIRVLKLPMIRIHKKRYLLELADIVLPMKNLRGLGVGKFFPSALGTKFFRGLEKILSKNGLVEFPFSSTIDFKRKMESMESTIDWGKIERMNPMFDQAVIRLVLYPENLSEWEWEWE